MMLVDRSRERETQVRILPSTPIILNNREVIMSEDKMPVSVSWINDAIDACSSGNSIKLAVGLIESLHRDKSIDLEGDDWVRMERLARAKIKTFSNREEI